jgi:hypothetical protein
MPGQGTCNCSAGQPADACRDEKTNWLLYQANIC